MMHTVEEWAFDLVRLILCKWNKINRTNRFSADDAGPKLNAAPKSRAIFLADDS